MTDPCIPPGLAALTQRFAIDTDAWSTLGRLDVRIDGRARVRMRRGRRGQEVVLETRLVSLRGSPRECEDVLARAMLCVTAGAGRQVGVVALSPDGQQLVLQAELAGGEPDRFEAAFTAFLNEADYWNRILGRSPA